MDGQTDFFTRCIWVWKHEIPATDITFCFFNLYTGGRTMNMKTALEIITDGLTETHKDLGKLLSIGLVILDALRDAGVLNQPRSLGLELPEEDQELAASLYNRVIEQQG
jgi:hypothetical protein